MSALFCPLPKFVLTHGNKQLDLSTPQVMGILNVTPDSFSDGGQFCQVDNALWQVERLLDDGANIIDIGAESTRPNAQAVCADTEIERLFDVVCAIRQRFGDIWLSLDTSSPKVMTAIYPLGVDIWNDVRGLTRQGARELAAQLNLPVVIMHARGEPDTMNGLANYDDVVAEVKQELMTRVALAQQAGVKQENIVLDVGMGFAKNYHHHVALMRALADFSGAYPLLFGVSRKRFLGEILQQLPLKRTQSHIPADRDDVGAAAALLAVAQGASIIRTHHARAAVDALALWQALVDGV